MGLGVLLLHLLLFLKFRSTSQDATRSRRSRTHRDNGRSRSLRTRRLDDPHWVSAGHVQTQRRESKSLESGSRHQHGGLRGSIQLRFCSIAVVSCMIYLSIEEPTNNLPMGIIGISCLLGIVLFCQLAVRTCQLWCHLLNSLSGIAAAFTGFIIGNSRPHHRGFACWCIRTDSDIHHVQGDESELADVLVQILWWSRRKASLTRTKVGSDR